jgi:hypothetical protein
MFVLFVKAGLRLMVCEHRCIRDCTTFSKRIRRSHQEEGKTALVSAQSVGEHY